MMRDRRVISVVFAVTLAGAAHAEPVKIAAGEHGDYSRIVVPSGARDVQVDAPSRLIDIYLAAGGTADLSDITAKHKAFRVRDAKATDTGDGVVVRVRLACACTVNSVTLPSGRTVIDIADGEVAGNGTQSARPVEETGGAGDNKNNGELSVEEARNRMRDLLQRAADQGFVTMRGAEPAPGKTPSPSPARTEEKQAAASVARPAVEMPRAAPPAPKVVAACLPDETFAIEGGRFDSDPLGAIAEFRTLMEEAPEDERRAATDDFARGYLAVGFGEEALALLDDAGEDKSPLADMARIVAERPLDDDSGLMNAEGCKGAHALWRAAASEPKPAAQLARHSGDAIDALPKRLRTLLAARIAKKLIDAGAWRTAERFRDVVAAYPEYAASDLKYIEARLLERDGEGDEAEEMLRDVAAGRNEASQDALIALAERYVAEGATPDENFVEDLGALATRAKGSAKGGAAALHEAMIWTASGNVEAGVFLMQSAVESDPSLAEAASLEAARAVSAAFQSDDEGKRLSALRALLAYRTLIERAGLDAEMRVRAAGTAIEVGLPNLALQLLDGAGSSNERSIVLLKAKAALQAGASEAALASAAPYADDPAFAEIVVSANLQLERNYAALAAATALPDMEKKAETMALAAWRAGDHASAARAYRNISPDNLSADDAERFALSAYMAGEKDMPPAAEAALRRAEAPSLAGLKSLFAGLAHGTIAERGRALAGSAGDEIELIREILGHG